MESAGGSWADRLSASTSSPAPIPFESQTNLYALSTLPKESTQVPCRTRVQSQGDGWKWGMRWGWQMDSA